MNNTIINVSHAATSGPALPKGSYLSTITRVALAEVKSDEGITRESLRVTFAVVDGEHKGRGLYASPWYKHSTSEAAERIGNEQIKALIDAAGLDSSGDVNLADLIGREVTVHAKDPDDYSNGFNVCNSFS